MPMSLRKQLIAVAFVGGWLLTVSALAQEPFSAEGIPAGSDYVYRQQYEQVQEILKTPDLSEREKKLETYYGKLQPEAKIRQYMEAFFGQIVQDMQKKGMNAQADALTQKMMKWFPRSDATLGRELKAAFDSKNWAKVVEIGEKMRAANPNDGQVLVMLAEGYQNTNNTAKVTELAPKLIDLLGPKKAINYVVFLADQNRKQNNAAAASKYYEMALQAYPSGPPQGWQPDQWNGIKIAAYQLTASSAWRAGNYEAVIQAENKVLQIDPKSDQAYLFIGLSHWKRQELDAAQDAFAKVVVLGKASAPKGRQYLEQLYKPLHSDSLDGLDKLLDKAKADLKL
jgi:tetratricopeptide (TPR) repeat protein